MPDSVLLIDDDESVLRAIGAYLKVDSACVVTGCGSDDVLDSAIRAFSEPGQALAYPDTDIPLARLEAARAAFTNVKSRGFNHGGPNQGTWSSMGPSQAVYPFFGPRDLGQYVPNEYVAGGRTITPRSLPGASK